MKVKPGFKQTEVGVIPVEWDAASIGQFSTCFSGGTPSTSNPRYYGGDIPWITSSDLNRRRVSEVAGRITDDGLANSAAKFVTEGTLLIALYGATAGVCAVSEIRAAINQAVLAIVPHGVITEFLFHTLTLRKDHFIKAYTQGGQPNLSGEIVKSFSIPIPPLPEQHVIAATLSDVDALLGGLDRLIAKKRDLKQAAMQQLLTGQTRLPGFHGEWEVNTLKHAALISTGINKPLSEMGSGALYVTVQDLYDGTSIPTSRLSRIKVSSVEIETRALAAGDIVFGKSSVKRDGIGYPSQFLGCEEAVVFSGFTYRARARQGMTDPTFLFYALRTERTRRWLIDNSQASALTNINQTIADAIPVTLPPTLAEQTAIAKVLSDMDAELSALEARLDKTRDLKNGMMQELLTGRIRLI